MLTGSLYSFVGSLSFLTESNMLSGMKELKEFSMRALLQQDNESSRRRPFSPLFKALFLLLLTPVLLLGGWTTASSQHPQKTKEETTPKGFNQGGRQAKRARGKLFPPLVRLQKLSTNKKRIQNPLKKVIVQRGVILSL